MASRGELVQMCIELEIDNFEKMRIDEMTEAVRKAIDEKFDKKYPIGIHDISDTLLKFMYMEYDYVLLDKDGKKYDWEGNPI